jgi:hypothetical protein
MDFFEDVRNSFDTMLRNDILPVTTQAAILELLGNPKMLILQLQLTPNLEEYHSSSWNTGSGSFEAPLGGSGMPQSIRGSFSVSNTDPEFIAALPNVDQAAYSKLGRTRQSKTSGGAEVPATPTSHGATKVAFPEITAGDDTVGSASPTTYRVQRKAKKEVSTSAKAKASKAKSPKASSDDTLEDVTVEPGKTTTTPYSEGAVYDVEPVGYVDDSSGQNTAPVSNNENLGDDAISEDSFDSQLASVHTSCVSGDLQDTSSDTSDLNDNTFDTADPGRSQRNMANRQTTSRRRYKSRPRSR